MNDTKAEILRLANELIRSVGYNSFSYANISEPLNIKNAAVHYYFPAKADLGVAVIRENIDGFKEITESWKMLSYKEQYINYITMHDYFVKKHWVCIVGSLSPSFETLPEPMQKELQTLINLVITWLTNLLKKGLESKEFSFKELPRTKACVIHAALLSSLLMNKVLNNDAYKTIQSGLLTL